MSTIPAVTYGSLCSGYDGLNPALPEWMMGLRPGLLTGELSRNEALKGAGNGVVPQAVAAAWRILMEGEQL